MLSRRLSSIAFSGVVPVLVSALLLGAAAPAAAGQSAATPEAGAMACTEALGIGAEGDACINVIHASPDAPAVDVYVDGEAALTEFEFGTASGWVAVPAGEHQIQVAAAGSDVESAVIDVEAELMAGEAYEIAATGLLAEIAPQIYPVNLSAVGSEEEPMARIRVVHASPDAPAVDVAVTGGDVLISELAFPDASEYLEVPAGSYDLEVRPAGATDVVLELPGVELEGGTAYSVYAIGLAGDGSLTVLPVAGATHAGDM
jgi:hypothetical protein